MNMTGAGGDRIAVFGAGVMGVGITALALGHGVPVLLVDVDPDRLAAASGEIRGHLRQAQLMGALPDVPIGELTASGSPEGVEGATAVIEAVTEHFETKVKLHNEIAAAVAPGTPRITNTSSIPIAELAAAVPHPEDLVGVHFMNPPPLIRTVEVIRGPQTGDAALAAVRALAERLGRRPIVVADGPGFVTSMLLHRMINAAADLVDQGRASVEDVDALMEGCLGHPSGPLRTADLIGIDNLVDSLRVLEERTGDAGCSPSPLLLRKVAEGEFGRKTGRGFYEYAAF
ncbi:3-hydroxyacyl-CoA dehydrogenase family protein [Actinocorallia sp. API 0066]|uniref:3-hydroxyacyl-CoA dehydrogenase family protein n=1 Tax=Actinocorallia sp. API 0066 TaxID=2896846 RepID=UPI001E5365CA|nr:3-hydroxyacyl-CoA dehydrogenase family protein [Actinocorallia sp. API 0066]MCD0447589.1 3-hydroxyacyl-CoA dehydrogenase family protein [Actinocorallia sp. API 0066]